jgi:hypothetical protein
MTDPDYLAEPIGCEIEWVYSPDFEMVRLPCDPESAQRYLDLRPFGWRLGGPQRSVAIGQRGLDHVPERREG